MCVENDGMLLFGHGLFNFFVRWPQSVLAIAHRQFGGQHVPAICDVIWNNNIEKSIKMGLSIVNVPKMIFLGDKIIQKLYFYGSKSRK